MQQTKIGGVATISELERELDDLISMIQNTGAVRAVSDDTNAQNTEHVAAEQVAQAETIEQDRLAAEKAEKAAQAQKAQQERLAAEKAAQAEKAEQQRMAAEKAEQERLAGEKAAQAQKTKSDRAQRLAAEHVADSLENASQMLPPGMDDDLDQVWQWCYFSMQFKLLGIAF